MNEHDLPTLKFKLQQFASDLTPEEWAEVRQIQANDVTGMMSPVLRDKAQHVAGALTPEEQAHLRLILEGADVEGFAAAVFEDADGWKGRPGTNPSLQPASAGGGGIDPVSLSFLAIVTIGAVLTPGPGGEPAPGITQPLY